jgi:D-tyrosyl-tRNA(Tyr) deacylase
MSGVGFRRRSSNVLRTYDRANRRWFSNGIGAIKLCLRMRCHRGAEISWLKDKWTMRVVLQRVSSSSVSIDGRVAGAIGRGFCLLVGFTHGDTAGQVDWMADKVAGLRLFADADGKMNLGIEEVGGAILVVSQFTLYGDAAKGRRPSFIEAARPEHAIPLYERFLTALRERGLTVASGEFGADMHVEIHNDGPVTLILDRAP